MGKNVSTRALQGAMISICFVNLKVSFRLLALCCSDCICKYGKINISQAKVTFFNSW